MRERLFSPEKKDQKHKSLVDALLVLSLAKDSDHLAENDRLGVLGAGLFKDLGLTHGSVFLSSNPPEREGLPSRATLMRDYLKDTFGIPDSSIVIEDRSANEGFAQELKRLLENNKLKNIGLVSTTAFNNEKLQQELKKAGLTIEELSPDSVLADRFPDFLGNIRRSSRFMLEAGREMLGQFMRAHRVLHQSIHIGKVSQSTP